MSARTNGLCEWAGERICHRCKELAPRTCVDDYEFIGLPRRGKWRIV